MKLGIISLGGKSSQMLGDACRNFFDEVDDLDLRNFHTSLNNGGSSILYKGEELDDYDCLMLRGSFRYALLQRSIARAYYDKLYMPINPEAFTLAHDKFLTLVELQKHGLAIPKTHYAATKDLAMYILNSVHYPIIMKLQEGTHGKGVMIAESKESARTILDLLDNFGKAYIIQEFVQTDRMSDIRLIVVGRKVIAAYKRIAEAGDIRSNVHAGGTREKYEPNKNEKKLAIRAAKAIGIDICGVDVFDSDEPSIIEINLSPALHSIHEVSNKNTLNDIAQYLFLQTIKFKKKKEEKIIKKIERRANKKLMEEEKLT